MVPDIKGIWYRAGRTDTNFTDTTVYSHSYSATTTVEIQEFDSYSFEQYHYYGNCILKTRGTYGFFENTLMKDVGVGDWYTIGLITNKGDTLLFHQRATTFRFLPYLKNGLPDFWPDSIVDADF